MLMGLPVINYFILLYSISLIKKSTVYFSFYWYECAVVGFLVFSITENMSLAGNELYVDT